MGWKYVSVLYRETEWSVAEKAIQNSSGLNFVETMTTQCQHARFVRDYLAFRTESKDFQDSVLLLNSHPLNYNQAFCLNTDGCSLSNWWNGFIQYSSKSQTQFDITLIWHTEVKWMNCQNKSWITMCSAADWQSAAEKPPEAFALSRPSRVW